MSNTTLLENTQQLLDDPLLVGKNVDEKIRYLLKEEYLRRLAQYRRTISSLGKKYGMDFDEFVAQRIVKSENFAWHVETDAMEWETAVSGIKTIERKLKVLDQGADVQDK